jgi:hypothetical protein
MYNKALEGFIKAHEQLFAHIKKEKEQEIAKAATNLIKACVNEMLLHAEDDEWLDSHKVVCKIQKHGFGSYRYIADVIDEMVTDDKVQVLVVKTPHTKKVYIRKTRDRSCDYWYQLYRKE